MKRGIWLACWACAALLSACAALWSDTEASDASSAAAQPPRVAARLAQLGHGRSAAFALCADGTCPQATPKTLATTADAPPLGGDGAGSTARAVAPAIERAAPVSEAAAARPDGTTPDDAVPRSVPSPGPEAGDVSVTVRFPFGEAVLTPLAKAVLDAAAVRAGDARRLRIVGRTDSLGTQTVNDALARERARAVRDHLRTRLANWPATVDIESAGACCFAASNVTAQGRQANRRVEVTFSAAEPEDPL